MPGALPIRYRLTPRQTLVRALRIGLIAAVISIPLTVALLLHDDMRWPELVIPLLVWATVTLISLPLIRRGGIVLDEVGIRPLNPSARRHQASWHLIVEVRAERRGARTVPVVYLRSGRTWRLRVPYNGMLLGTDPRFDEKLCVIRNMWDIYRSWQQPPGLVDDGYSNTSVEK